MAWSLPLWIFLAARSDISILPLCLKLYSIFSFDMKSLFVRTVLRKRSATSAFCTVSPFKTELINLVTQITRNVDTYSHHGLLLWFVIAVSLKKTSFKLKEDFSSSRPLIVVNSWLTRVCPNLLENYAITISRYIVVDTCRRRYQIHARV